MADEPHGNALDVDTELAVVRKWLAELDLPHAAVHLAQAIAADPSRPEPYAELDRIPTAELFPLGENSFIGNVAARSYLAAREGDWAPAMAYAAMCLASEPDRLWMAAWWDRLGRVEPATLAAALAEAAPTFHRFGPTAALRPFLELARRLIDTDPTDIELAVRLSVAADALGAKAEGASWREHAASTTPGGLGQLMLGYALRDAGRVAEMEAVWTRAAQADPADVNVRVALALSHIGRDQFRAARRRHAEALRIEPSHADVRALGRALEFRRTGDPAELVAIAASGPGGIAGELLTICSAKRPWLNYIPMPTESIIDMVNQVAAARRSGQKVTITQTATTATEPPSAVAAAEAYLPNTQLRVLACPAPDLRVPLREGVHKLWEYGSSTLATPVVAAPSKDAADLLRTVANLTWTNLLNAYERSAPLGRLPLGDLLGLLCHMPPHPDNARWNQAIKNVAYWPRLAAGWVCLGILHHRPDEPWASSTRRQALVDLVFGIEDWASDSALFALVVEAWRSPDVRDDVRALVVERLAAARHAISRRVCTIAPSIATLALITPGMPAVERRRAQRIIDFDAHPPRSRLGHAVGRIRMRLGR